MHYIDEISWVVWKYAAVFGVNRNMGQRASFSDLLIAANRILLELAAIDPKERTTAMSPAIRECLRVYTDLLRFEATAPLTAVDDASLRGVMERMKTHLTYFGEDV
jgi:hypothetical protein